MKIRVGFVSNSSSSSYILGVKKEMGSECPCCHRKGIDIIDLIDRYTSDTTGITCIGKESVTRYYTRKLEETEDRVRMLENQYDAASMQWRYDELERIRNTLKSIMDISDEYEVVMLDISYHDIGIQNILQNEYKTGNIIIIYDYEERMFS